jgi:O-antigen/teichoic acid export membrane protein
MSSVDFAAFNSLLSIFMLISTPLATLQTAVVKYVAEFKAQNQAAKIHTLLSYLARKVFWLILITFFIFYFLSSYLTDKLKIPSLSAGYILALLLALSWITPVLTGALQGLELFKWLVSSSLISGALKLILAFLFISLGFNIAGALGAFLVASFIGIIISFFPLKNLFSWQIMQEEVNFKEFFTYLFPVAISSFCFVVLVNSDMVLVKYFFSPTEAGFYSLAQMLGKIFLFLPAAISVVMFPRTTGLNAQDKDTRSTLTRSLLYACGLCLIANIIYNLFPSFFLKVLTGKVFAESVILGRLFGVSMSFFTLLYILITYFLSLKDLRFMKYLILCTLLQVLAIILFHQGLIQILLILCINSILLFFIHLALVYKRELSI